LTIDIDLGLSPWANASQYYDQKKQASEKAERTAQSSTKALKSHEKKVTTDLKKNLKQEKEVLRQTRTPFWFEKFIFFISSEGYLVIGYVTLLNLI
jgi:predicted ribosome quality control (RQC) complex YloA/Tae2 family protein